MHLHFTWNENAGEARLSPKSLASVAERFAASQSPIDVLDFLKDVMNMAEKEYADALREWRAKNTQPVAGREPTNTL